MSKSVKAGCNVCGAKKREPLYKIKKRKKRFAVVRCPGCGLLYVHPPPPPDFFDDLYEEEYFCSGKDYRSTGQFENPNETPPGFSRMARLILEKRGRRKKKGRYLDVGCASGHYVQIFNDMGWDSTGIDVSEYSTRFAREVRGLSVLTGDVVEAGLPKRHYDVITLLNVIEHLPDPGAVVTELERLLKRDGILVISTPNAGSVVARIRKEKWWGYDDVGHLHFFSLRSLERLLDRLGMEMFALDCIYPYGYSLGDVLKRDENRGKRLVRSCEYLLQKRITPVTFGCCRGITDLLAPGITCFIRRK